MLHDLLSPGSHAPRGNPTQTLCVNAHAQPARHAPRGHTSTQGDRGYQKKGNSPLSGFISDKTFFGVEKDQSFDSRA